MPEPKNPLPHLFVGDWVALEKNGVAPDQITISLLPSSEQDSLNEFCSAKTHFTIDWPSALNILPSNHRLILNKGDDLISCPTCESSTHEKISVCFWRQSSYDMIFALKGPPKGDPSAILTARRAPFASQRYEDSALIGKPWKIKMSHGHKATASEDFVMATRLVPAKIRSNQTAGLWGLFHSHTKPIDDQPGDLYDLLVYNNEARTFNSVFDVRSFNLLGKSEFGQSRVLATFNNKFSLPPTRLGTARDKPKPASKEALSFAADICQELGYTGHKLGQLLPFEADTVNFKRAGVLLRKHDSGKKLSHLLTLLEEEVNRPKNTELSHAKKLLGLLIDASSNDGTEEDDPDLGVWVGLPV